MICYARSQGQFDRGWGQCHGRERERDGGSGRETQEAGAGGRVAGRSVEGGGRKEGYNQAEGERTRKEATQSTPTFQTKEGGGWQEKDIMISSAKSNISTATALNFVFVNPFIFLSLYLSFRSAHLEVGCLDHRLFKG